MYDLKLFALSTCIWCRKTIEHLNDMGFKYELIYVDQLNGEARKQTMKELESFNPSRSFPTLIINGRHVIVGYKPEEIKAALQK